VAIESNVLRTAKKETDTVLFVWQPKHTATYFAIWAVLFK
jgi:hypothetical protein